MCVYTVYVRVGVWLGGFWGVLIPLTAVCTVHVPCMYLDFNKKYKQLFDGLRDLRVWGGLRSQPHKREQYVLKSPTHIHTYTHWDGTESVLRQSGEFHIHRFFTVLSSRQPSGVVKFSIYISTIFHACEFVRVLESSNKPQTVVNINTEFIYQCIGSGACCHCTCAICETQHTCFYLSILSCMWHSLYSLCLYITWISLCNLQKEKYARLQLQYKWFSLSIFSPIPRMERKWWHLSDTLYTKHLIHLSRKWQFPIDQSDKKLNISNCHSGEAESLLLNKWLKDESTSHNSSTKCLNECSRL